LKYRVGEDFGGTGYVGHSGSEYVMLAREEKSLPKEGKVVSEANKREYMEWITKPAPGNKVWTDDYTNMVGVLKEQYVFTILIGLLAGIGVMVTVILLYGKSLEQSTRTHGK
jgi:hypothetical protein